jgi:hypothetical protein
MHDVHLFLSTSPCKVVYICLGTNDLDSGASPSQVAHKLWDPALSIQARYKIRYVFIDQIINRDPVKFPGFAAKALVTNAQLEQLTSQAGSSVKFWKHRNFRNPATNLLCDDGVHLNTVGLKRYWRSLRGAIIGSGKPLTLAQAH